MDRKVLRERRNAYSLWKITTSACTTAKRYARLPIVGHNMTVRPSAFPPSLFKKLRLIWHQIVRAKRLQAAYRKAEATFPRENAPKAEDIRGLGLLGKESQSAKVLGLE